MKKIRIKNLRAIKDTGNINIKPLTILLGKNSVGKSTLLRTFPLIKQSLILKRSEPILWYSPQLVDFGNFKEAISNGNINQTVDFEFTFNVSKYEIRRSLFFSPVSRRINFKIDGEDPEDNELHLKFSLNDKEISKVYIELYDFKISYKCNNSKINEMSINDYQIEEAQFYNLKNTFLNEELIPQIYFSKESSKYKAENFMKNKIYNKIEKEMIKIKNGKISDKTIESIIDKFQFTSKTKFTENFEQLISNSKIMKNKYNNLEESVRKEFINRIYSYNAYNYLNSFLYLVNNYLNDYFRNSQYIAPIRASAERYYRIQGLSIDEIAPQGENIPMILRNMTRQEQENWESWTNENFGVQFKVTEKEANISINLVKGDKEINLADTGFGYSQLLPLLVYCWRLNHKKKNHIGRSKFSQTLIIEQPELHLHPALQSQLLEVFVEIIEVMRDRYNFAIILETHSETIINYLGYLIANKEHSIKSSDVNILLFDESRNETIIKEVTYSNEGFLENWPFDFFMPVGRAEL